MLDKALVTAREQDLACSNQAVPCLSRLLSGISWFRSRIKSNFTLQGASVVCTVHALVKRMAQVPSWCCPVSAVAQQTRSDCAQVACAAHVEVMRKCRPGLMEYALEAVFLKDCYLLGGCRHAPYTPICASGPNGAVLHYGHAAAPNGGRSPPSHHSPCAYPLLVQNPTVPTGWGVSSSTVHVMVQAFKVCASELRQVRCPQIGRSRTRT